MPFTIGLMGSEAAARAFSRRFIAYHDRPNGFRQCLMMRVSGVVPASTG